MNMIQKHKLGEQKAANRTEAKPQTLRKLLRYATGVWHLLALLAIVLVSNALLDLAIPWIIGFLLIDRVIRQHDPGQILFVVLLLTAAVVGQQVTEFLQQYLQELGNQRVLNKIRCDLYAHTISLPVRYFDQGHTGELLARLTGDVDTIGGFLDTLMQDVGSQIITLIGVLGFMIAVSVKLTLYLIPTIVALVLCVFLFKKTVKKFSRRVRDLIGVMTSNAGEAINGVRVVKAFCREKYEVGRFSEESQELLRGRVKLTKLSALYSGAVDLCGFAGTVIVVLLATPRVLAGAMTLGALVAFLSYVNKLYSPVKKLSKVNLSIQRILAAGDRVFEVMSVKPEAVNDFQPRPKGFSKKDAALTQREPVRAETKPVRGAIRFENVSFSYNSDKGVLKDFSLDVQPGQVIALVGPSGGGKTTIVHLLLRFYEPTSGRILLDGVPLNEIPLHELRSQIGVVTQDTFLFSGTSRDNIAYAFPDATDEQIIEVARAANAHEFLSKSPQGYLTAVGERGLQLSGGQRQRIAIARALLRNPRIMIFDEATSHLDSESERLIQESLERIAPGRTVFIVAHRLSTIRRADKIVVIEDGAIAEMGKHEELLVREGRYRKLLSLQTNIPSANSQSQWIQRSVDE